MNKKIFSVGYEIPGDQAEYLDFSSEKSLMDADILLICPNSIRPHGDWVNFTSSDDGCYNIGASKKYKEKVLRLKKEIVDHLNTGKCVFVFLTQERIDTLSNNVSTPRKGQNSYSTELYSNYNFLPASIGTLVSVSGNHIQFSGNPIFSEFYKKFEESLEYQVYIESINNAQIIFTGKDRAKVLGAVYKIGAGNLIVLPYLNYDYDEFVKTRKNKKGEEKEYWTDTAMKFGYGLVESLIQISNDLGKLTEKTSAPKWLSKPDFINPKEVQISLLIKSEEEKITNIKKEIEKLNTQLGEEKVLKDLLFEQGAPLENAVIKALRILDYKAENYSDSDLELDQVIISPEGNRYIGECEGKNDKDIDITKLRQLIESMNADFHREEVEEKAFGILFGNPQRLTMPTDRTLDFTKKCKIGAAREKIALIRTADFFKVVKYLTENTDEKFKSKCREAIHSGLGGIVVFPNIPPSKKDLTEIEYEISQ